MNVKYGWPTLSFELHIILYFRERKGILERESENFTKKMKEFSKEILRKVAGFFGGVFWKSLIGFQGLVGVFACLDKR